MEYEWDIKGVYIMEYERDDYGILSGHQTCLAINPRTPWRFLAEKIIYRWELSMAKFEYWLGE